MDFEADDRVICINDDMSQSASSGRPPSDFRFPGGFIREGDVYHVYEVRQGDGNQQQLRLTGFPVYSADGRLGGWASSRFRPYRVTQAPHSATAEEPQPV